MPSLISNKELIARAAAADPVQAAAALSQLEALIPQRQANKAKIDELEAEQKELNSTILELLPVATSDPQTGLTAWGYKTIIVEQERSSTDVNVLCEKLVLAGVDADLVGKCREAANRTTKTKFIKVTAVKEG